MKGEASWSEKGAPEELREKGKRGRGRDLGLVGIQRERVNE